MTPFRIAREPRDHALVLLVEGDLDIATAPELRAVLDEVRRQKTPHCIVDLTGCTFIDSSGSRAIANQAEAFDEDGLVLAAHCPLEHRKVRFVIDLVGLPEVMNVTPTGEPAD
jgi:anti-sigma B factor antagonist